MRNGSQGKAQSAIKSHSATTRAQSAMQVRLREQPQVASGDNCATPVAHRTCRGQSAIEYLITYGWMVIALLAIVATLFYLGVFNPANWLSSTNDVVGTSTFSFQDYTIRSDGLATLYIKSESPYALNVTGIAINGANLTGLSPSAPIQLNSGQTRTITGNSTLRGSPGDPIYNVKIEVYFSIAGGGNHTDSGVMRGKYS